MNCPQVDSAWALGSSKPLAANHSKEAAAQTRAAETTTTPKPKRGETNRTNHPGATRGTNESRQPSHKRHERTHHIVIYNMPPGFCSRGLQKNSVIDRLAKLLGKQPFGFPYHRDSCQLSATAGIFQMAGTAIRDVRHGYTYTTSIQSFLPNELQMKCNAILYMYLM